MKPGWNASWKLDLVIELTLKELRSRYKSTALGFLWMIVNPLLQLVVFSIVFTFFVRINISNYPLFLLSGLIPWMFFTQALTNGTTSILSNRDLVKKSHFPHSLLPLATLLSSFFHFLPALGLMLVALWFFGSGPYDPVLLIPTIALQLILTTGLVLVASCLTVYYRDVPYMINTGLMLAFYATPIIYEFSSVPDIWRWFYSLNPMVGILLLYQQALAGREISSSFPIFMSIIICAGTLIAGIFVFRHGSPDLADWV